MSKRAIVLAVASGAMVIPSLAGATAGHGANAAGRPVNLTQHLFQYASTGAPPASGSNSYVGTSDGRIGGIRVHGALRGTNTYSGGGSFTGKNTIFDSGGSIVISFKARVGLTGTVLGSGNFAGGTGRYKGAHGRFTFTAEQQGPSTFLRVLKGKITYP